MADQQSGGGSGGGRGLSRRKFLQGATTAGVGGLVVGGAGGFVAGRGSKSSTNTTGGTGASTEPILIGSASPVTGPFASDGQQMVRGQQLAIDEINANGGLLGRQLKLQVLDSKAQEPDVMKNVLQKLVSQNVAAIFAGFTTYTSVEFPIVAQAGMPMFHVNTWHGNVEYVQQNNITNIFQGDPSETSYGSGFITLVNQFIDSGAWTPSSKSTYVVTSNDPYSLAIAKAFKAGMEKQCWKTLGFEQYTVPQADYGGQLVKIRNNPPGIVFFSSYAPGDEASFIKQFAESPTPSLVYEQYAPSIPEYLDLAKDAANGVLWSTVVGVLAGDDRAKAFIDKFTQKFSRPPGFSNAGDQYDLVHLWAEAAAVAGDPFDFAKVNAAVANTVYRGTCGAYSFLPGTLTCYPYPDETLDPSLGMAHLTFQIQNGEQVLISPDPYTTGKFELPSWLR
ncbi:MAG: branched-chain amino acid ABC transporter substrate-binding protein [Actinobacteria bacterium]|nr:branched-chain amino acid ABC transporter substrate-binding protein [Actinomycetota bacterium]